MGRWSVDTASQPGLLILILSGQVTLAEMLAFVEAHNAAVQGFAGHPYKVFCDLRGLRPLSQECAEAFESAKRISSGKNNFEGSAVLVDAKFTSMQHRRTSVSAGVANTELITESEEAALSFLRTVSRSKDA